MPRPSIYDPHCKWLRYADELEAENAKLREAAQAVVDCLDKDGLDVVLAAKNIRKLKAALEGVETHNTIGDK